MIKKILIFTILRDEERYIENWYNQLKGIIEFNPEIKFGLSVYENDSKDKTTEILDSLDFSFIDADKLTIKHETLNNNRFQSVNSGERVKLLSEYRNKCLDLGGAYAYDYFLLIESDVTYDPNIFKQLFDFTLKYDADIVSPLSLVKIHNDEFIYDGWATRIFEGEPEYDKDKWDIKKSGPVLVYSTCSGVCLYKNYGINFGYQTDRANHDCDTVVICDKYQKMGHNKIFILPYLKVQHPNNTVH